MRFLDYFDLKPGMRVAHPIFSRDRLLLREKTPLTTTLIGKLPLWGIFRLGIMDEKNDFALPLSFHTTTPFPSEGRA